MTATNVAINRWTATWNSAGLLQGQYLIGVQAVDDGSKNADGYANRVFSYLSEDEVDELDNDPPSSGEEWYPNPDVAGSVTTTKGTPSGPDPLLVDVGTLDVGESVTVTFQVTVNENAVGQTIANRAWAGSDQQVPQAYTPPDGGTVFELAGPALYLPFVARNA